MNTARFSTLIKISAIITCMLPHVAMAWPEDALVASTYLGGSGGEGWQYSGAIDVAVSTNGQIFVVGITTSTDFPTTPGVFQCVGCGNDDIFIARMSGDLSSLVAATVIGGSQDEVLPSVALGADGTVYVAGHTASTNFPVTAGAYETIKDAGNDIFVAKFSADLTSLLAATYLGGNSNENSSSIDLDPAGEVVVCGVTTGGAGNTFPTTTGAYDSTYSANYRDFFVSKLNSDLSQLMASTFLGGRYEEAWGRARVDPWGNIIVGGSTESDDYPSTPGAYGESFHGPPQPGQYLHDVVISKLSNDLTSLLASTFIGTAGFDGGQIMTLDNSGNVIVGGHTDAIDYPVTPGALDEDHNGVNEYMLTKVDNDLTSILASTFLTPDDAGFTYLTGLATDAAGNIYGVGSAWETHCPTTPDAYDGTFNGGANDFGLMKFDTLLTTLEYGTFVGGSADDGDCAVAAGDDGYIVITGYTQSADMPIIPGAYDAIFNGGTKDAYVAKFDLSDSTIVAVSLAGFDIDVGTEAVRISWQVNEKATAGEFSLAAKRNGEVWELPIEEYSQTEFGAEDRDPRLRMGGVVDYTLFSRNDDESWGILWSERVYVDARVPRFVVGNAHPNPFGVVSTIPFSIADVQTVKIGVFDAEGRRVAVLDDRIYPPGNHTVQWDGRDRQGRKVSSGLYFLRVRAGKRNEVRKLVVVR